MKIFQVPPKGKVVLVTNLGKTGITLRDVVFVIDSRMVKLKIYDALTNTTMLRSPWISQTSRQVPAPPLLLHHVPVHLH